MRRRLTLDLDDFGRTSLKELADAVAVAPDVILRQAARHFLDERQAGRLSAKVPRFSRHRGPGSQNQGLRLEIELEESEWGAMEVEAVAQRISLERLLEHAVLLLLADVHSGRLAVRIATNEREK
jgi:hypothetical protein